MRGTRSIAGFIIAALLISTGAGAAQISNIRIADTGDRTRVVLEVDGPADHTLFTLTGPDRVVVDLDAARIATAGGLPAGAGLVGKIRAANRENGVARLVFDLKRVVRPKSFSLQPGGGFGHRIVVDLYPASAASPLDQPPARKATRKTPPNAGASRDLVIAIDAGHGGKDPGARGHGGLVEKVAVLQIARRLAALVDAEPGMRAYMTRKDDRFLKLGTRMQLAQQASADLFISIHADAFTDRRVRGATVYVLSEKGASDEAAALLAQRENAADLIGGVDLADKDDMLARVLVDLSQNASMSSSIEAGEFLVAEMQRVGKVRKGKVQKAGFRVLKSADIPSILVETAFISNPQDESNLRSVQYQQRLAQAMHNGIRNYFYANPPLGTRVAALARSRYEVREHVIRSGDTLSEIARRYKVSVDRLRAENKLDSTRIRIGQVLRIPPTVES